MGPGDVWGPGWAGPGLALAEYALEGGAGEPYEVAACVHVEGYGLGRV